MCSALVPRNLIPDPINTIRAQTRQSKLIAKNCWYPLCGLSSGRKLKSVPMLHGSLLMHSHRPIWAVAPIPNILSPPRCPSGEDGKWEVGMQNMKQHGRSERLRQSMCCSLLGRGGFALVKLGNRSAWRRGVGADWRGSQCGGAELKEDGGRLSHRHGALWWLWLSVIMLPQRSKRFASIVAGSCRRVADKQASSTKEIW